MTSERLQSLDVFRGFDMMMIVGFGALMIALDRWLGGPGWLDRLVQPGRLYQDNLCGRVVVAAGSFLLGWLVVYFLYRKKTFLKV